MPTDAADDTAPPRTPDPERLEWTAPPRAEQPPQPPAHASTEGWHPSDMLVGVDPASALVEAIRQDLAPALGDGVDDAMVGVIAEFGPDVLPAKLTHESGMQWSHDISVLGGRLTVKVRPIREATHEYVGPSKKFESDLSFEAQSSIAHLSGNVVRTVAGARLQVPFPHGSASVQVTRSDSLRSKDLGAGGSDAGQLSDASNENTAADVEERIPTRVKTVEPHDLFRQPVRFEISYERHLGARVLRGLPETPHPVKLLGVFSYPQKTPTPLGPDLVATKPDFDGIEVDQLVVKVRPPETDATGSVSVAQRPAKGGARGPDEDLMATHVLDEMAAEGVAAFGDKWPKVRAELVPHIKTAAIQRDLGPLSKGGTTTIHLTSVRGGTVVLRAHIDAMRSADSNATSEFYSGGQRVHSLGMSTTEASNWQAYVQVQGDALPGHEALNLSVIGRVDGGVGRETISTRTESSATGLLFRQKVGALNHVGTATVEATMSRPGGLLGLGEDVSRTARAKVEFVTRESPAEPRGAHGYVVDGVTEHGLSPNSIARKITNGPDVRDAAVSNVRENIGRLATNPVEDGLTQALDDASLEGKLPAMTRGDVELFRDGSLLVVGAAEVQALEFIKIEKEGGNANVLNEVNQSWATLHARSREGGLRAYFGPHWQLPSFAGSLLFGGGASGRQRFGASFAQTAKVSANSKFSRPYAIFEGTTSVTLTVRDGTTTHRLPALEVIGSIMVPVTETRRVAMIDATAETARPAIEVEMMATPTVELPSTPAWSGASLNPEQGVNLALPATRINREGAPTR